MSITLAAPEGHLIWGNQSTCVESECLARFLLLHLHQAVITVRFQLKLPSPCLITERPLSALCDGRGARAAAARTANRSALLPLQPWRSADDCLWIDVGKWGNDIAELRRRSAMSATEKPSLPGSQGHHDLDPTVVPKDPEFDRVTSPPHVEGNAQVFGVL